MTAPTLSAEDIARELADRLEALVSALAPSRYVEVTRTHLRVGNKGSLSIKLEQPGAGQWTDFKSGKFGDALDLVRHLRGGDLSEAFQWALGWLGKSSSPLKSSAQIEHLKSPPRVVSAQVGPKLQPPTKRTGDLWAAVWREGQPAAGSPVERYLASRGLVLPPDAPLRYHPACPRQGERLPAMVALMRGAVTGEPCGVHRTYLRPDGGGKADVAPAKMMLGAAGIIRLCGEVTGGLGIAEGIETSLAIIQRTGWSPIWATGSAGAIAKFPVLAGVEALTIWADHDPINPQTGKRPGLEAAGECAARWFAAGREATVQQPPAGEDWLDALGRAE